jgi:hypothetical protein
MTTLYVIHDHSGKIVAASESKNPARPKELTGLTTSHFDVPTKFAGKKLREYAHLLSVDVKSKRLREK